MLKHRYFISYFSTTIVYLSLFSLFFYVQNRYLVSSKTSEEKSIQLCMASFTPEVMTPIEEVKEQTEEVKEVEEPVIEEEPVVEEKPLPKPQITKKTKIKEEVIPEPIVAKPLPKPLKTEVKQKPKVKEKSKKKRVKKKQVQQRVSARKSKSSAAKKNQFLADIRAKINQHKSYPRIAKKRGMQGTVNVKFTILSNGQVGNISVSGPKVFHTSARRAVKSAFPVSAKNAPIKLPKSINITLRYQIR